MFQQIFYSQIRIFKLFVLLFVLIVGQLSVQAHVSSSDNGIDIMMHINPNDTPTTEQTTDFNVYLNDSKNKFRIDNCICVYKIQSNQNTTTNSITQSILNSQGNNDNSTRFNYDFKDPGSYTITFVGEPKVETANNDKFSNFRVSFDFWVNQKAGQGIKDSVWVYYFTYLIIFLTLVYFGWLVIGILRHLG